MRFKHEQSGFVSSMLVTVILSVLLLAAVVFGVWAFISQQDYKNNSDTKSAAAVALAEEAQKTKLDAEFAEKEKSPFETFTGPAQVGSVTFTYPKTWELYADMNSSNSAAINAYAHPGFVPALTDDTAFALRAQIVENDYTNELKSFDNALKAGKVRVSPFRAVHVPSVLGSRIDGEVKAKKSGHLIILPLRDKTLKIWTESDAYANDFNTLLNSLSFVP